MTLEILTPEKKIFSGEVYGVQLPGIDGSFEVLDRHAPLVSALQLSAATFIVTGSPLSLRPSLLAKASATVSFFNIQSGFVEVINNTTTVLVEGATEQ